MIFRQSACVHGHFFKSHSTDGGQRVPTKEAVVVSRGKRVSQHHHGGVDDDLLTLSAGCHDLSPPPATVQPQIELSAIPVQLHLVPVTIAEMLVREGQVIVSISKVVENSK